MNVVDSETGLLNVRQFIVHWHILCHLIGNKCQCRMFAVF